MMFYLSQYIICGLGNIGSINRESNILKSGLDSVYKAETLKFIVYYFCFYTYKLIITHLSYLYKN